MQGATAVVRPNVCSRKSGLARRRQKPPGLLSEQVDDFTRSLSSPQVRGGALSPSARAALVALIATLADLLGESPLVT